jgi:mono/diheme cytochrome c family protein
MKLLLFLIPAVMFAQGNPSRGKTIFIEKFKCYACHGTSGQSGTGARLVPMKMTEAAFMAFVRLPREPRPGSSPAGQQDRMPPYSAKVLPDSELSDIYAYLKTLPEGPAAKDIPLLRQIGAEK